MPEPRPMSDQRVAWSSTRRSSPSAMSAVREGDRERAPSFPGGGRIHYVPGSATGYIRGIGIVGSHGRVLTFPAADGTFPYWDPSPRADILVIDSQSRRQGATSYLIAGDTLQELDSWRLDGGPFAVFARDGRWIAEQAFNRRGRMKEEVIRIIDRATGEVSTHRTGLTPLAWAPDGRLLAAPWGGGDVMLWDPQTGRTTPLVGRSSPDLGEIIWSPDERMFAARVYLGGKGARHAIAVGTIEGDLVVVSRHGTRWVEIPTWSPDGRRIAFIVRGPKPDGHRHSELFTYDVVSERKTVVAGDVSDAFWASWSPDGEWLLLDDWTRHRWLFVAADGSQQITYPRLGHFPRWCCPSSPPIEVHIPVC